jgi:hypothetical protein
VLEAVSGLLGKKEEEVAEAAWNNSLQMFGIKL